MPFEVSRCFRESDVKSFLFALLLFTVAAAASAEPAGVVRLSTTQPMDEVYARLYKALEDEKFWVVFEADMGERMARFAERWGEDYNTNALDTVKSMVFCSIWWTNRIANADPNLLALCPLHVTLYAKGGETVVLMPRLSAMAEGSPGRDKAAELEAELREILEGALASE